MSNKNTLARVFLISSLTFAIISFLGSNNFTYRFKLSNDVLSEYNFISNDEKILVWIEFTDKGNNTGYLIAHPEKYLTEKAIERRKKVKPEFNLTDITDIPVNQSYLKEVTSAGIIIKNKSKWFNRVSCFASRIQIEQIAGLEFVKKVDLVRTFRKKSDDIEFKKEPEIIQPLNNGNDEPLHVFNYGNSITQMELIKATTAHDSGFYGQGVLIASLDAGFDNLMHPSFDSLRARGLRTYDFVNGDTNVADQQGQMGEGSHGTMTLSLVGGYKPGSLISPAFRSRFILAKTENTDSETPLEEDNWIAAAEWADSLGADIITSSLGYIGMDQGSSHSYDWTWMNGDSCVVTIGADMAVHKGIIVCNSAGNEGFDASHNTLGAPSDGDSVIAVGSCDTSRRRSSFSSVGLSVDGRIKPDVVALGRGNIVADWGAGSTGYTSGSGTSFSCPMTAGVCAIILSANPNLTPMQVRSLLTQTADSSFAPNRRRGWGLINCWEAVKLARGLNGISSNGDISAQSFLLRQNYPNPFNPSTTIDYELRSKSFVTLKVYDISGRVLATLTNENQNAGIHSLRFDAVGFTSGVYFYKLETIGESGQRFSDTKRMVLLK